ncbi:hypothetical protein AB6N24_22920, partial [Cellulomonas sp. 179-A 4D5 NHS]|uniref:hypothetical protein n=1 Tax=Cellulomonas sp. 179-A 4D5 NHS TaxID=3142378 RepID=UPI0039A06946
MTALTTAAAAAAPSSTRSPARSSAGAARGAGGHGPGTYKQQRAHQTDTLIADDRVGLEKGG